MRRFALRSVIAEDGTVLISQSYPQAERGACPGGLHERVDYAAGAARYGASLGAKYPGLHLAGKTGTTNNNVDTWFAGIDGSQVTITWWVATITSRQL